MRISYIHQHFTTPDQPGGSRPWEMAKRLRLEGHDVTVHCGGAENHEYTTPEGVKVLQHKAKYQNRMSISRRLISFTEFMARSSIAVLKDGADVVFASSTPLTVAVPGLLASWLRQIPFVFEVRDLWPAAPIELGFVKNRFLIAAARSLERLAYSQAHVVIALSDGMAEGVRRVSPSSKVVVVPNAADMELFALTPAERDAVRRDIGVGPGEKLLVYAGSLGKIYVPQWLVLLAKYVEPAGVRVVIVGDGAMRESAERLAAQLGLDCAMFKGSLPRKDAARYVAAADATLSSVLDTPVLGTASLNKFFDTCAAGRPMFTNHGGWISDLLESSGAGWDLSKMTTEHAALRIVELLGDSDVMAKASGAAYDLARSRFGRDMLYRDFRNALLDTVTAPGG